MSVQTDCAILEECIIITIVETINVELFFIEKRDNLINNINVQRSKKEKIIHRQSKLLMQYNKINKLKAISKD